MENLLFRMQPSALYPPGLNLSLKKRVVAKSIGRYL